MLLYSLPFAMAAQQLEQDFSVNRTGTGMYKLECKSAQGMLLGVLNGNVVLDNQFEGNSVWRKSRVDDAYFYLDCINEDPKQHRLRATSYLGTNLTTSGLEGNNHDVQWRLIPSGETGWGFLQHRTTGRLLCFDGDVLSITDDKTERDAIKWRMTLLKLDLEQLQSPRILMGDDRTGFRDPCVVYHDGMFYMYHSVVLTTEDEHIVYTVALSKSEDLVQWTSPRILTEIDQLISCSSPGSVTRFNGQWILCLQTYPMPGHKRSDKKVRYGNENKRNWIMRSDDLENWSKRELLKVMGPDVDPGPMIDPFIVEDKDEPGKWWCFFKKDGASYSYSHDLENWTYAGNTSAGENVCVWVENDEYLMMHSPANGVGILRSKDLKNWDVYAEPEILGQEIENWTWAGQRVTAGHILDLRADPRIGKYLLFYHGQGPAPKSVEIIHSGTDMGVAWSDDLKTWDWPGKK